MKKHLKILSFILSIFTLLICFASCNSDREEETKTYENSEIVTVDKSVFLSPDYVKSPYFDIEETDSSPTDEQIRYTISNIRSDRYEEYPVLQNIPISATLYKDGDVTNIALDDPRLIRLINFFNNALHYDKCAYLLCNVTEEMLAEDIVSDDFRLELRYQSYGDTRPSAYENSPTDFDTMIITNRFFDFTLINHDAPIMDGSGGIVIPFTAATYDPYFHCNITLADFGF